MKSLLFSTFLLLVGVIVILLSVFLTDKKRDATKRTSSSTNSLQVAQQRKTPVSQWQGLYSGCLNTYNVGDLSLYILFPHLLRQSLQDKYSNLKVELQDDVEESETFDLQECVFGVVGGGTIIHSQERSYTVWVPQTRSDSKILLFGTGISNPPELNSWLMSNGPCPNIDLASADYNIISTNLKSLTLRDLRGNFRGPYESKLVNLLRPPDKVGLLGRNAVLPTQPDVVAYDWGILFGTVFPSSVEDQKIEKQDFLKRCRENSRKIIAINFLGLVREQYLFASTSKSEESQYNVLLEGLIKFVKELLDSGEYAVVTFLTGSWDRYHLPGLEDHPWCCSWSMNGISSLLGMLKEAYICIGCRLHAAVTALSVKVPTVLLAYHPKLYNFASSVGLTDYTIPYLHTADKLKETFYRVKRDHKHIQAVMETHIERAAQTMRATMKDYVDSFMPDQLQGIQKLNILFNADPKKHNNPTIGQIKITASTSSQ